MNSLRYLNTILTAVAILLGLQLWTSWNTTSQDASSALVGEAHAAGLPDAGAQRKEMIIALNAIRQQIGDVQTQLASGKVRVQIQEVEKKEAE